LRPAASIIFEASLVVKDSLLIVFQNIDEAARLFLSLDLKTGEVADNKYLVSRIGTGCYLSCSAAFYSVLGKKKQWNVDNSPHPPSNHHQALLSTNCRL
jgi:hypothetical protein